MKYRYTAQLINLTYEAALKSFWRKNALKKFLRTIGIKQNLLSNWDEEETKRSFLDRLFEELQKNDTGKLIILEMAKNLAEQTTFPDLKNWEDSDQKIKEASEAVNDLKSYLENQNRQIQSENEKAAAKDAARKYQQKVQRQISDKNELQNRLNSMYSEVGTQNGGYSFQDWFYDLLDFCEIDNKRPYTTDGRQIDGSLTLDGTTYLIELKFTEKQTAATDIDSLKSKIDKMADNTMGILISISGFSSVAISEASGKKTTILLMDSSHIFAYLTGVIEMTDIIRRIRRHASQTGEALLPVDQFGS
jgi:ribosomal protein S20